MDDLCCRTILLLPALLLASRPLVDDLVAWGDEDAIRARVAAHHDAPRRGRGHVASRVLNRGGDRLPAHRALATALLSR
jgi:hypothetical protein